MRLSARALPILPLVAVAVLGCGQSAPRSPAKLDTAAAKAGERQAVLHVEGMV